MDNEFQCIKIKDGLYLGTLPTVQDYQFLQINKFSYVVNCSVEIPNYYDNHGIKYLKFKLIKDKSHKLWDQNLKKLRKLQKFIEEAEDLSLCCMIFSASGNNRSLVMLCAYLMSKYRWNLDKTLAYIRSKNIFIGLSESYIIQLEQLQHILNRQENKPLLSSSWKIQYRNQQQELISKTFLNSQQIVLQNMIKKEKKEKRISWQDKIDKQKKKQIKESKLKKQIGQKFKKTKSNHKLIQQNSNQVNNSISNRIIKKNMIESPLKKPQSQAQQNLQPQAQVQIKERVRIQQKKKKKDKACSVNKVDTQFKLKNLSNYPQFIESRQNHTQQTIKSNFLTQKQLLKLIKKNLKIKKETNQIRQHNANNNTLQQHQQQKNIYKLTINNFISPNINIVNSIVPDKKEEKNSKEANIDKNARTYSQKQIINKGSQNNKTKNAGKSNKSFKKNTENSVIMRDKKMQKAVSVQIKHQ